MSKDELLTKLRYLAASWRETPHLSNDNGEALEYNKICEQLRDHGVNARISAATGPTDYQVFFD